MQRHSFLRPSSSPSHSEPKHSRFSRRDSMRWLGLAGLSALFGSSTTLSAQEVAAVVSANMQGAGFYKRTIGQAEVVLISDGGFEMQPAQLFSDVPANEIEKAMAAAFLKREIVPGHVNALLVREGTNRILIDTGCGGNFGPSAGFLIRNLERAGLAPGDITHVVITHAHPDHIGGLVGADGKLVFPNAAVVVSEAEHAFWTGTPSLEKSKLSTEMQTMVIGVAQKMLGAAKPKLELAKPGDRVGAAITIVDAPGHTPGHIALSIESGGESVLYVTDAVHVPSLQLANPDWHVLFDADPALAAVTRRMLLEQAATQRTCIAGAHIPFPSFGHLSTEGTGYRFTPTVWEW